MLTPQHVAGLLHHAYGGGAPSQAAPQAPQDDDNGPAVLARHVPSTLHRLFPPLCSSGASATSSLDWAGFVARVGPAAAGGEAGVRRARAVLCRWIVRCGRLFGN